MNKLIVIAFICIIKLEGQNSSLIKGKSIILKPENTLRNEVRFVSLSESTEELEAKESAARIKRNTAFENDEGSGDARRNTGYKNQKGVMQASKSASDLFFVEEKDNITNVENVTSSTFPALETTQISSTWTSSSVLTSSTSSISTEPTRPPHCYSTSCEIWLNYTASIEPNHITAPEGVSFELSCSLANFESSNISLPDNWKVLWTIEHYEDGNTIVDRTILSVANSTETDSGIYVCLLISPDKCCQKKTWSMVNIYKKPNYALHLIITGAICGIQILACIPFALYTRRKMKYMYARKDSEAEVEQKLIA